MHTPICDRLGIEFPIFAFSPLLEWLPSEYVRRRCIIATDPDESRTGLVVEGGEEMNDGR